MSLNTYIIKKLKSFTILLETVIIVYYVNGNIVFYIKKKQYRYDHRL